jgi:hypothetical protein
MAKQQSKTEIALGLVLIFVLLIGLYYLLRIVWINFVNLPKEVASTVVTAGFTAIVGVSTVFIGRYFEKQREIENHLRMEKVKIFQDFLHAWFNQLLKAGNKEISEDKVSKEFEAFVIKFTPQMILWCSDDFIQAYNDFRKDATQMAEDPMKGFLSFERLLIKIRKEVGIKSKDMKQCTLLRAFINDFDNYVKAIELMKKGAS